MYLVDTDAKAILVYEAINGARGFSLVAGRPYVLDREYMRNHEIPYRNNGYTIRQIQEMMAKAKK